MRKTVFALSMAAAGLMALSVNAQEVRSNEEYLANTPSNKVAFEPSSKHWFIQLFGGINVPAYVFWKEGRTGYDALKNAEFKDKYSWSAGFAFGQWHNPYFGTRLAIDYNNVKAFGGKQPVELRAINPHFDFMFDMINYFSPYNPDRGFSIVPYVGLGYFGSNIVGADQKATDENFKNIFKKDKQVAGTTKRFFGEIDHAVSANIGIDFNINFSRRVALTIEPSIAFVPGFEKADHLYGIRGGLTFNVGDTEFNGVVPMDWELVNGLQSQINDLRSQNAELSKRPVRCPDCPEVVAPVVADKSYENIVYFRIGSAKIDRNQEINLFNTAEFVKANNTPITVTGYADVQTGTSNYNMQLSEKRARNVADRLIKEYGVSSELITIDYKGSDVQPYNKNAWNRVVIMRTK